MSNEEVLTPTAVGAATAELRLIEWASVIWRRRLLILVAMAIAGFASWATPRWVGFSYEACVSLVVSGVPGERAQTVSDRVSDPVFLGTVIERLQLELAPQELARRVSVVDVRDAVQVSVRTNVPEEGLGIAQTIADEVLRAHEALIAEPRAVFERSKEQLYALRADAVRQRDNIATVIEHMRVERRNDPQFIGVLLGNIAHKETSLIAIDSELRHVDGLLAKLGTRIVGSSVAPIAPWPVPLQRALVACLVGLLLGLPLAFLAEYLGRTRTQL